jgi:hypothetical protein
VAAAAYQGHSNGPGNEEPAHASPSSRLIPQVTPPIDIKAPPGDAARTASGLAVKKLTTRDSGALARRGNTVMVHYTAGEENGEGKDTHPDGSATAETPDRATDRT